MAELVEFLRARLDEEAARAQRAIGGPRNAFVSADEDVEPLLFDEDGVFVLPARVLRDVEADRALLDQYAEVAANDVDDVEYADGWADALGLAVRCRALRFVDHPDYREEWRP